MTELTLTELAAAIAARKVSALEATDACLERIGRLDGRLRAFITLDAEGARARARALDADLAALAGAIERMSGELALGEEPSNFVAALDAGAPRD